MADRQGFEPWIGYSPMPVFKTGAFNRSAICPYLDMRAVISSVQTNDSSLMSKA